MSDKKSIDPEGVYPISAAARLLSVSPSTLRDLERQGKITCTWTPGRQRRFAGAELLRLLAASRDVAPKEPAATPSAGRSDPADATARRAWLAPLITRVQRALPVDTPAAIRLRVGTDLEQALRTYGPSSSLSDAEPLITSVIERATDQVQAAQEEAERREIKRELVDFGLRHLHRRLDRLSTRLVGPRGSFRRRHIQATLRDQFRDQLQKQLRGDEAWDHVRALAEDAIAAWVVAHPSARRLPTTAKIIAAGATGVIGGAAATAALSPEVRARVVQLGGPLRAFAEQLLTRLSTPPPTAAPPTTASDPTPTTPPSFRPGLGVGLSGPRAYRSRSRYSRPNPHAPRGATPEPVAASNGQAPSAPPTHGETGPSASSESAPHAHETFRDIVGS